MKLCFKPEIGFQIFVILITSILVLLPIGMLLWGSFSQEAAEWRFTLSNYAQILENLVPLRNTLVVSIGATLLSALFGVSLAWVLARTNTPLRETYAKLVVVPFYLTPFIGAIAWTLLASSKIGVLNKLLMMIFNLKNPPMDVYSVYGIIWVMGIYYAPFVFLYASTALKSMDPALEESARVLGTGVIRTAFRITLPLISPAILSGALLTFVSAMGQFGIPIVLGMPKKYYVLTTKIVTLLNFYPPQYTTAAAMGMFLLLLTAFSILIQRKLVGEKSYVTISGRAYRPKLIDLRAWRYVACVICGGYVLLTVILPLFVIIFVSFEKFLAVDISKLKFTLDKYKYLFTGYPITGNAIKNSLFLAIFGGAICILFATLISYLIHRSRLFGYRFLDYLSTIPVAVPGVVMGVGLLWAWISVPVGVYGTIWILMIAYITMYLPFAVKATSTSLIQIDKQLEESSRLCGASWGYTLWKIVLPLLKPGLLSGWTLLFILFLRELSASILLYSSGNEVFSVAIFDLWDEGLMPMLCALAVIQIVITFVALLIAGRVTKRKLLDVTAYGG